MSNQTDWKGLQQTATELTNKHALESGRAISAWNYLHDTLARIFAQIAQPENQKMAFALWYAMTSDRTQRSLLKTAAVTAHGEASQIYVELKWICDRLDAIGNHRNNAVHFGYSIDFDKTLTKVEVQPRAKGLSAKADKMSGIDIFAQLDHIEKSSKALLAYAVELGTITAFPGQPHTWPGRPALPVLAVPPTQNQTAPQRQKKPRRPPPQS